MTKDKALKIVKGIWPHTGSLREHNDMKQIGFIVFTQGFKSMGEGSTWLEAFQDFKTKTRKAYKVLEDIK